MKKILLMILCTITSLVMSAQEKGDMYVSGSFNISGGNTKTIIEGDQATNTTKTPSSLSFSIAPEVGFFIMDNLKVGLKLSYGLSRAYKSEVDNRKLYRFTHSVAVVPNVSYYLRIVDKLYYTPGVDLEIGASLEKNQINSSTTEKTYVDTKVGLKVNLLSLEYRFSDKLAITGNYSNFAVSTTIRKTSDTSRRNTNSISLNMNPSTNIGLKYYF